MDALYDLDGARIALERVLKGRTGEQKGIPQMVQAGASVYRVERDGPVCRLVNRSIDLDGDGEEVVVAFQGVLVAKDLPPVKKPVDERWAKYGRQRVVLTGLGLPMFEKLSSVIMDIHSLFLNSMSAKSMQCTAFTSFHDFSALEAINRYLTPVNFVKALKEAEVSEDVDPLGHLRRAMGSRFVHMEDNAVMYHCLNVQNSEQGVYRFDVATPAIFQAGDIVEIQVSFVGIMLREGQAKLSLILRGISMLDNSFSQDAAMKRMLAVQKRSSISGGRLLKRRVGYEEENEHAALRARQSRMQGSENEGADAEMQGSVDVPLAGTLASRLHAFETQFFSMRSTEEKNLLLLKYLGIKLDVRDAGGSMDCVAVLDPTSGSKHQVKISGDACAFLSTYRLLDALAGLEVSSPTISRNRPIPRGPWNKDAVDKLELAFRYLNDWPETLLAFKRLMQKKGPTTLQQPPSSPIVRVIRRLVHNRESQSLNIIETNFLVCTMNLAMVLNGGMEDALNGLGLPEQFEEFINRIGAGEDSLTAEEIEFLKAFCDQSRPTQANSNSRKRDISPRSTVSHLQNQLQLGLMLTFVALFSKRNLGAYGFNKQHLLDVAKALGNERPPLLRTCDRIILTCMLRVASGEEDPANLLSSINDALPWQDIENLAKEDAARFWFTHEYGRFLEAPESSIDPDKPDDSTAQTASIDYEPENNEENEIPPPLPSPVAQANVQPPVSIRNDIDENAGGRPKSARRVELDARKAALAAANSQLAQPNGKASDDSKETGGKKRKRTAKSTKGGRGRIASTASDVPSSDEYSSDDGIRELTAEEIKEFRVDVKDFTAAREPNAFKTIYVPADEDQLTEEFVARIPQEMVKQHTFWDADGGAHPCELQPHHIDYIERLDTFYDRAKESFVNDLPPHVSDPVNSTFGVMPYDRFLQLGSAKAQELLEEKTYVITNCPPHPVNYDFDKDTLSGIIPLSQDIPIQADCSFKEKNQHSHPLTVRGSASQLLKSKGRNGKVLNALDLPQLIDGTMVPASLATDITAWHHTRGVFFATPNAVYPLNEMNWFLAGTADAITWIHSDAEGTNTGLRVMCGMKYWGIITHKQTGKITTIDCLTDAAKFALDIIQDHSDFRVEFVALRPSDMLLMRAGQLHMVVGPVDTICRGFHFYGGNLMQYTLSALIHTFSLNEYITNTTHAASRQILRSITIFFYGVLFAKTTDLSARMLEHVPDMKTWKGVINVVSACILSILGNVLDFRTYLAPNQTPDQIASEIQSAAMLKQDINDIPWCERISSCVARGVGIRMLHIINDCCRFTNPDGKEEKDLVFRHVARLMKAIESYRVEADKSQLNGAPHCTHDLLVRQLKNVSMWSSSIGRYFDCPDLIKLDTHVLYFNQAGWKVTWDVDIDDWMHDYGHEGIDFVHRGSTFFDCLFFATRPDAPNHAKRSRTD
ncbi:hypothetical protein CVT24_012289 [Panaeolus cyanescens]|uniref:JmjC domain-containing protein n=1 Tax=Panaeolus cyanescens TaxID=181874 RepID=A0A409YJ63_9AGAR|nr:hypothetical protein CVT24_012289 [Panaeolus cyanescens]